MPSTLHDRNNHVPAVAPEDDWSDVVAEDLSSALPPRRPIASAETQKASAELGVIDSPSRSTAHASSPSAEPKPLRIDSQPVRLEPADPSHTLFERVEKPHVLLTTEELKSRGRPSPDRHWGKPTTFSWRWAAIAIGSVISAMILGFVTLRYVQSSHSAPPAMADTSDLLAPAPTQLPTAMAKVSRILEDRERSWMILEAYSHAKEVDDFLPWMRAMDLSKTELRAAWQPWNAPAHWSTPLDLSWMPYGMNLPDGGIGVVAEGVKHDFSPMMVFLTEENGRVVMDWKATEAYGSASFAELTQGTGNGREIRGFAREDRNFSLVFPETQYLCHQFFSPDESTSIWVYTERTTPAAAQLLKWQAESDSRLLQITVHLEPGPAPAQPNQWTLVKTLYNGWMQP